MQLNFEEKYFIMLGKEYLIKTPADEIRVLKKQKRIYKKTGKKPNLVVSFRNGDLKYENEN